MLIGLSGKQGTGKSTIAKEVQDNYENVKIFKMAGILYELQDYIYNRVGLTLQGEKDRPLLVSLGMWGRSKDENLWVNVALSEALEHSRSGGIALIDDIRFPNEADGILENNGLLLRIEGEQRGPYITQHMKQNVTETSLDSYPFKNVINNNQTIDRMMMSLHQYIQGR